MGAILSKRKADKAKKVAREKAGFHPKRIYFDEDGNLKHGWDRPKRNKEEEMAQIIETDNSTPEDKEEEVAEGKEEDEGKMVYVVNVTWVNAWLAFVHLLKTSPEPGPCDNTILLERDEENKCWIPLADLVLARKAKRGDYRHVTEETWRHINKLYPGSGPAIKIMSFKESKDHKTDGLYDTSDWEIDQKGFVKLEEDDKKKKKRKERKDRSSADAPSSEMIPLVRKADAEVGMEDEGHKVDERMGKFFGDQKASSSPSKAHTAAATYNPIAPKKEGSTATSAGNDENAWLFS